MDLPRELADVLLNELKGGLEPLSCSERERLEQDLMQAAVSPENEEIFGRFLRAVLHGERLRRLHGPHAELHLRALYRRLPLARQLSQQAKKLTEALQAVRGHELRDVRVSVVGPCSYLLTIDTDRCRLQLEFGPDGVQLKDLELGL